MLAVLWMTLTAHADVGATMSGRYQLADSPAEVEAFKTAAIERTLASMNFALRAIAGSRVESAVTACNGYDIQIAEDAMTVTCDAKPPVRLLLNGQPSSYTTAQGVNYAVTAQRSGDQVTATFSGNDASQVTVYDFSSGQLSVHKTINSPYFGAPLQWTNNYRR